MTPYHAYVTPHNTLVSLTLKSTYWLTRLPTLAGLIGLEPTTHRLTADCSAIELVWHITLPLTGKYDITIL